MRINMFSSVGPKETGGALPGQVITTPLFAARDPSLAKELATKGYADAVLSDLSTHNLTEGQFRYEHLSQGFSGFMLDTSTGVLTLAPSGVEAGSWSKVQVDSRGLIVHGGLVNDSSLPDLSWGHVSSNKPTTVSGYGITDALTSMGGTVSGNLSLVADPTDLAHAATKRYVDGKALLANAGSQRPGDLLMTLGAVPPSGFLRPNGSEISKSTYHNLYQAIGDAYGFSRGFSAGTPWRQQHQFNASQDATLPEWFNDVNLPAKLSSSQAAVTKNRVYLIGGSTSGNPSAVVYSATLANGNIGTWTEASPLPAAVSHAQVIVTLNRIYLLGGIGIAGAVKTAYTATINSDGSLGAWNSAAPLPVSLCNFTAVVTNSRIYLLGGSDTTYPGVALDKIYSAPIGNDGVIGTYIQDTLTLPQPLTFSGVAVTKNRLFLVGGVTDGGSSSDKVYTCTFNATGVISEWQLHSTLPGAIASPQIVVTAKRLYVFGGKISSTSQTSVYETPVNVDGTLGTWNTATTNLPPLHSSQVIVTSSKLYKLGGASGDVAPLSELNCYSCAFTGGLNSYAAQYDGTNQTTDANNFKLPALSTPEPGGHYLYIKY